MAGNLWDDEEEITGINITPLVDVMLVLLVIFMVTASFIVHKSINVELPKTETAAETVGKKMAFSINSSKKLFLDGKEISFTEVGILIDKVRRSQDAKVQALISADIATPHGIVVKLIDTIRKNGITDFAINVDSVEETTDSVDQ